MDFVAICVEELSFSQLNPRGSHVTTASFRLDFEENKHMRIVLSM